MGSSSLSAELLILRTALPGHLSRKLPFSKPRPKLDSAHLFDLILVIMMKYEMSSPSKMAKPKTEAINHLPYAEILWTMHPTYGALSAKEGANVVVFAFAALNEKGAVASLSAS